MKHYSNLKFIEASPLFKGLCQRQVWEADFWVRQDNAFQTPWIDRFDNGGKKVRKQFTKFVIQESAPVKSKLYSAPTGERDCNRAV